jgi:acyl-CoA reductase-like NAD-dependent aldehyde dehydrogenase
MILSASQLRAIKERNDEELRKGRYAKHGYPAHTIQDLLHTIEALKKEKKKWQHLAQERGEALRRIRELTRCVEKGVADAAASPADAFCTGLVD